MRSIVQRFRGMIALYVLIGFACAFFGALSVALLQRLVDGIGRDASLASVLPVLTAYGAATLATLIVNYLQNYPHNRLRHAIYHRIKVMALEKIARIDYASYLDLGTGRLIQTAEHGAASGRDILFEFYLRIAADLLPGALVSTMFVGMYSLELMFAALGGYVVVFLISKLLLGRLYATKERTLISEELLSKTYVRAFMELVVFRIHRRFGREIRRAEGYSEEIIASNTRIKMIHELFFVSFAVLVWAIKLAYIAIGITMIGDGRMTVGVLLALIAFIDRIYEPIAIFNVSYVDYKLNRIAWERFQAFMGYPDDTNLSAGPPFVLGAGAMTFENVHCAYGSQEILRGITLNLRAGKLTAIVGASGAGKTTIAKLALGLIKPTQGRVAVDGQDLRAVALEGYYPHVAYISQDAPVFDGTLRENVRFDGEVCDGEVVGALERAGLAALLRALPRGLDTEIGERGVKLSGGEKQRLALARVLLARPAIVVLDEPTSALDTVMEQRILDEMTESLAGCTVLSIAHRMSTVRGADHIVVLGEGRVLEEGTHEELEKNRGAYAALLKGQ